MIKRPWPGQETAEQTDWGYLMHQAAEKHLAAVWASYEAAEEGDDDVESPKVGPFDGCEICVLRETLAGAWPVIEQYAEHVATRSR